MNEYFGAIAAHNFWKVENQKMLKKWSWNANTNSDFGT